MTDATAEVANPGPIIARAGRWYRNARYIMIAAILFFAGYFAYDGWVGWPKQNARIREVDAQIPALQAERDRLANATSDADRARLIELDKQLGDLHKEQGYRHSDTDIMWQKILAIGLPFVAAGYAAFFINRSRGEIRFENQTLTAPGHPVIPLSAVQSLDQSLWNKKGIAYVTYDVAGKQGTVRLDDFVYEQQPIDAIFETIARHLGVWVEPPAA